MEDINIIKGMTQKPMGDVSKLLKQMQGIVGYLQHIENGLVTLSHEVQAQGLGLQMILQVLIDKKICTEEEIKQYHTDHVFTPMKEAAEALKAKMEEAEAEAKRQIEAAEPNIIVPAGTPTPKTRDVSKVVMSDISEVEATTKEVKVIDSDVVLASERNNVTRFPNDKQDG